MIPMKMLGAGLVLAIAMGAASVAQAGPVTYTQTVDHVSLRMPAPIGPRNDVTVTLVAQADTNDIFATGNVFGINGKCVLATSATITVTGVATQTIASPIHVCVTNSGERAGFYTTAGGVDMMMASPSAYVIDLDQDSSATYGPSDVRPGVATPNLAVSAEAPGGGNVVFTYAYATHEDFPNTIASSFVVDVTAAPPPPPPPAAVPTLSEWAMILLGLLLAGGAALHLNRRRSAA